MAPREKLLAQTSFTINTVVCLRKHPKLTPSVRDSGTTTTDAAKNTNTSRPKLLIAFSSISTSKSCKFVGRVGNVLAQEGGLGIDTAALAVVSDEELNADDDDDDDDDVVIVVCCCQAWCSASQD